ncbi:hypothetical protein LCGC14_1171620, partial [marine sediment metagenome]
NPTTGVPDEKKEFLNEVKKKLKDFSITKDRYTGKAKVQTTLFPYKDSDEYSEVALNIFRMEEDSIEAYKEKKKCYFKLKETNSWRNLNLQANMWTSSFFWKIGENFVKEVPTDTLIFQAKQGKLEQENKTVKEIDKLSKEYNYFNWFLEFPEVFKGKNPGFDCILMNPPWEVITLKEMEFFRGKSDQVIKTQNQSQRHKEIKSLLEKNPKLHNEYVKEYRSVKKQSYYYKNKKEYSLVSRGAMNIFALFLNRTLNLINENGKIGAIVQSTILSGKNLSPFFQYIVNNNCIENSFVFLNEFKIFPDVVHNMEFCTITLSYPKEFDEPILMAFSIWDLENFNKNLENYSLGIPEQKSNLSIREGASILTLKKEDFTLFNPNTKTSPNFKRLMDFELVRKAYLKVPILIQRDDNNNILINQWSLSFKRILDTSNDSKLFFTQKMLEDIEGKPKSKIYLGGKWLRKVDNNHEIFLPIYSGSAIWYYDHRFNDVFSKKDKSKRQKSYPVRLSLEKHKDPYYFHKPMYWLREIDSINKYPDKWEKNWFLCYRAIGGTSNQRTLAITVMPKYPAIHTLIIIYFKQYRKEIICFLANSASIICDYIVRNKITGTSISQFLIEQLPIFSFNIYSDKLFKQIRKRIIKLVFTTWDMKDFALDFKMADNLKPYEWNEDLRFQLITELDAIFAMMYGFSYLEVEYIVNSFKVLRDIEIKDFGEFRTKKLILDAYNKFNSDPELGPLFRLEGVDLEKLKGE